MNSTQKKELLNYRFEKELLIKDYINSFIGLIDANFLTGYWDQKRNALRKDIDAGKIVTREAFVNTERESRKNCELRAVHRTKLDFIVKDLFNG